MTLPAELIQDLDRHFYQPPMTDIGALNRWLLILTAAFIVLSCIVVPSVKAYYCPASSWPLNNWCTNVFVRSR
jgi:hypothetical protein